MERKDINKIKGKVVDLRKRTLELDEKKANIEDVGTRAWSQTLRELVDSYVSISCDLDRLLKPISDKKVYSEILSAINEKEPEDAMSFIFKLYKKVELKMERLGQEPVVTKNSSGKNIRIG